MICRHCAAPLARTFVDLGTAPAVERLSRARAAGRARGLVSSARPLSATPAGWSKPRTSRRARSFFAPDYAYFSGVSQFWVAHCDAHAEACIARFGLGADSFVVEVASKRRHAPEGLFPARRFRCSAVEPTASTAAAARAAGVPTLEAFFGGRASAPCSSAERGPADLICANNVLAPRAGPPTTSSAGFAALPWRPPHGVATFEFPSLVQSRGRAPVRHDLPRALLLPLAPLRGSRILVANGLALFRRRAPARPTAGKPLRL